MLDFLDLLGLGGRVPYARPSRTINRTMSDIALRMARGLNRAGIDDPEIRAFKWWVSDVLEPDSGPFARHRFLPPRIRFELLRRYRDDNRQIALRYLGREDGRLFVEEPTTEDFEWDDDERVSMTEEQLATLMLACFRRFQAYEARLARTQRASPS